MLIQGPARLKTSMTTSCRMPMMASFDHGADAAGVGGVEE